MIHRLRLRWHMSRGHHVSKYYSNGIKFYRCTCGKSWTR